MGVMICLHDGDDDNGLMMVLRALDDAANHATDDYDEGDVYKVKFNKFKFSPSHAEWHIGQCLSLFQ